MHVLFNTDINIHMQWCYNAIILTRVFFTIVHLSPVIYSHLSNAMVCIIKSFLCYDLKHVQTMLTYHGTLRHDMSYVMTIATSLFYSY